MTAIRALPRRPVPQRDDADPMPRTAGQERPTEEGREDDVGGSNLERPIVMKDQKVPRELRIDGRLLEKFGYTDECLGCLHRQMKEPGHRPHSSACRRRIYDLMTEDEDELDRINWNDERMGGAAAARDDPSRQPQVPTQKSTQATVDVSVGAEGGRDIPSLKKKKKKKKKRIFHSARPPRCPTTMTI